MVQTTFKKVQPELLPDHTQLPESDGTFVKNFQEHPQSIILTDSLLPILEQLHPDGQYAIGQDCGIYWKETEPPESGAEAPDWFYVPGVPPRLEREIRRSYVLWKEQVIPLVALEFASGNGKPERDNTPMSIEEDGTLIKPGKFWVYEQMISIPYYGIYIVKNGTLEFYHLQGGTYFRQAPNERGHYPIPPLGVELGVWHGVYLNQNQPWMRWWDDRGNLLPLGNERAELERQRAELERQRAKLERQRAEQEQARAEQEQARAEQEQARAEQERARAEQERARAQKAEQSQQEAIPRLLALGLSTEQVAEALSITVEVVRQFSE